MILVGKSSFASNQILLKAFGACLQVIGTLSFHFSKTCMITQYNKVLNKLYAHITHITISTRGTKQKTWLVYNL